MKSLLPPIPFENKSFSNKTIIAGMLLLTSCLSGCNNKGENSPVATSVTINTEDDTNNRSNTNTIDTITVEETINTGDTENSEENVNTVDTENTEENVNTVNIENTGGTDDGGTDGGNTDGGNTDGGNTDGGNTDGGNTDGGNTDGGNTDGGNTEGGDTDGGDTDGGDTDGGDTDGGDTDGGDTDGGDTDGGDTDGGDTDGGDTDGGDTDGGDTDGGDTDGGDTGPMCDENATVGLNIDMEATITLAESRYTDLLERISTSSKKYTDIPMKKAFGILKTQANGQVAFCREYSVYLHSLTSDESWKTEAITSTTGLSSRATATDNDTGFQIYGSYGIGREVLGGTWAEADTAINQGATTLIAERYNPNVGAFRAWPQGEDDPYQITNSDAFEVNVDMIMNMEVILSAAEKSGDQDQIDTAISHADIAWETLMRVDYSSFHVAGFNADGSLRYNRTHQGWEDDSTWSRGQSWAVYGYAMLYRYTGATSNARAL